MSRRHRLVAAALAVLAVVITGCAQTSAPQAEGTAPGGGTRYPLTVTNCGEDVVFDAAPERVILLESAPVTILDGLGVLDRVVARAGSFPNGYYDADLARRIEGIDSLSDDIDASGHLTMSPEVVLAHEPDLALGLPEGVTREALRDSGVNALIHPVYCPSGVGDASFDTLYDQVRMYGEIFDRSDEAESLVRALQGRVAAVMSDTADVAPRTAAVLYPSVGGGPLYAYGRGSMSQPQLEAAGFENVFSDAAERVFEVSVEELIARDPDVLILLHQGGEDGVAEEIAGLPGSEALRALENGDVLLQLFNFTEPPTPLSVDGLELIVERFGS
ncbi:ABC transporter substrate-binding protein [Microbacterium sp. HD4P20]|uniref:ABC transporter substrate-binding protein n=1 Tax=Microbacterium sp. HD4P20 TaxID=2864874 RepID=UPI001C6404BF|nr:ABC transporter substrate-binding protein [Microbacterium sp. HD4P20]MCP2635498.1 ABC transporter substrate-binding protein [Microbacterium sp. HD4P20]